MVGTSGSNGRDGGGDAGQVQGGFAESVRLGRRNPEAFSRELIGYLKGLLKPDRSVGAPTLEIGAATGKLTGQLQRANVEVIALERSYGQLGQLRRALPLRPTVQSEVEALPIAGERVGAVIVSPPGATSAPLPALSADPSAPLPAPAPGPDVGELRRVLRPSGLLITISRNGTADSYRRALVEFFELSEKSQFEELTVTVWH